MATKLVFRFKSIKQTRIPHLAYIQSYSFFFRPKYEQWGKAGHAIEIGDDEFIVDENFSPHYNSKNDVIIKNYSSALTSKNINHLCLPFNELMQKRLFYTNFCGIIQHIPSKWKKHTIFNIGDKVWGIKAHYKQPLLTNRSKYFNIFGSISPYSYHNAWSEYIASDIRYISHLPLNIPLKYGGLFPTDLLMIFDGFNRINYGNICEMIKNKNVLIIGSGRGSLINILIAILKLNCVNNIRIISSNKRHSNYLKKLNIDSIVDLSNFYPEKHDHKYDLIIDTLYIKPQDIENNVHLLNIQNKSYYWVIRNPMNQFILNSKTSIDVVKQMYPWTKKITQSASKMGIESDVIVKPIRTVNSKSKLYQFANFVEAFSHHLESNWNELKYPIIVDRLYNLNDIEYAFDYCIDYDIEDDNYILGEHIGFNINNNENDEIESVNDIKSKKIKVWKPMQIQDIKDFLIENDPKQKPIFKQSKVYNDNDQADSKTDNDS